MRNLKTIEIYERLQDKALEMAKVSDELLSADPTDLASAMLAGTCNGFAGMLCAPERLALDLPVVAKAVAITAAALVADYTAKPN